MVSIGFFYTQMMLMYCLRKNTEVLSVAIKEICLEVNAEKTKYVSMP
jgi:hypothetical protein